MGWELVPPIKVVAWYHNREQKIIMHGTATVAELKQDLCTRLSLDYSTVDVYMTNVRIPMPPEKKLVDFVVPNYHTFPVLEIELRGPFRPQFNTSHFLAEDDQEEVEEHQSDEDAMDEGDNDETPLNKNKRPAMSAVRALLTNNVPTSGGSYRGYNPYSTSSSSFKPNVPSNVSKHTASSNTNNSKSTVSTKITPPHEKGLTGLRNLGNSW